MRKFEIKGSHSGHTLVGAILDCHPNIIVANTYGYPLDELDILDSYGLSSKWEGSLYNFEHFTQKRYKLDILWVGNTGVVMNPDKVIGVVRNPFVMAYSLMKKHKTEDRIIKFMDKLFGEMKEDIIFYGDILESPVSVFTELANKLRIQVLDYWLDAITNLVKKDIPQPELDINLDILFNKYSWLERYRK